MSPLITASSEAIADPVLAARLRRLSNAVRWLILLGTPILLTVPVLLVAAPESLLSSGLGGMCGEYLRSLLIGEFTMAVRLRCAAVSLIPLLLWAAAAWQLWSLFGRYRLGDVFSPRAATHLRRFAWLLLALAAASPVSRALMSVAVSWDNPVGKRMLQLSLDAGDYQLLLFAAVFVAVARVMAEAVRVVDENRQFV